MGNIEFEDKKIIDRSDIVNTCSDLRQSNTLKSTDTYACYNSVHRQLSVISNSGIHQQATIDIADDNPHNYHEDQTINKKLENEDLN